MSGAELRRPDLEAALVEAGRRAGPTLLTGPPGAGKTRLLRRTAAALEAEGAVAVYLDLLGAASSPDGLVRAVLRALPAARFGSALAAATEVAGHAARERSAGAQAVRALLRLLAALTGVEGRPVVLLLDEATELPRSLAYFEGLRHVARDFGETLAARRAPTLLATSLASQARQLWPAWPTLQARPLRADELGPAAEAKGVAAESLHALSFGWPRYVDALLPAVTRERGLVQAWCHEMAPDGRLEVACRHTWETLVLRSRGYGMAKAALEAVAEREGQNLTSLVERLGRTPGAVRDYLGWLLAVDGLRMVKKRYYFVDGLLRSFLRLHGRGVLPSAAQIEAEAERLLAEAAARSAAIALRPATAEAAPPPAAAVAANGGRATRRAEASGETAEPEPTRPGAPGRRDSLIEID